MRSSAIPLSLSLTFILILLAGCGDSSKSDGTSSQSGLPQEIVIGAAIAKTGYLAPYDGHIAAI